jgi:hypothetical protein
VHEGKPNVYHRQGYEAHLAGTFDEYYASLVVDDDVLARGREDGSLVVDTRLRDALRTITAAQRGPSAAFAPVELAFPRPSLADEASLAVDVAVLGEANLVRLQRRLDSFEERLARVDRRLWMRLRRRIVRLAARR